MDRQKYEALEMEIIPFETEDVIEGSDVAEINP